MSVNKFDYVISGGAEGKSRLNMLASVLEPYTLKLLTDLGLQPGMAFLDNGCGGGNVAIMVAGIVGSTGAVTAVDFDAEIIRLAEADREQAGLAQLRFIVQSSYDLDFNAVFDFSYARFLLSHLTDPLKALNLMHKSLKPGGRMVAEDVHFSGHFCYPANRAFDRYLELYAAVVDKKGGHAELGPQLPGLFRRAGLEQVGFDLIQPCFDRGEGKWMAYITLARIKEAITVAQLATEQEVDELLHALSEFTIREDTVISLPRIFRVWGNRPE